MESVAVGILAALIGVLSGQGLATAGKLSKRMDTLEAALPELISRAEVQSAFQQVAQIEAQRMQQQQAQAAQIRQQSAFANRTAENGAMNQKINEQLAVLGERMKQINNQFGLDG